MKKLFALSAAALLFAASAQPVMAQDETEAAPYTFVGVQGGVQNTLNTSYNNWKTFTPTAALSIGHFFTPVVGARLNFNGIWNKGCASTINGSHTDYYNYKYLTSNADVLVNLCTLFGKKDSYPVNVYFIGGIGVFHAWDNKEAVDLSKSSYNGVVYNIPNASTSKRNAFNGRLGLQVGVNICKWVDFNLEGSYNMHAGQCNKFNSDDQQLVFLAGFNFKFGYAKKQNDNLVTTNSMYDEAEAQAAAARAAAKQAEAPVMKTVIDTIWYDDVTYKDVTKPGDIDKRIFFNVGGSKIDSSDEQVAAVADFLKGVKDGEVRITSYADKGTGTAAVNMRVSKVRAQKTKAALVAKGVDPSIIKSVEWKGDTVQPYSENDKNRVSIITGHGTYQQKEKVVTKKFRTQEKQVRAN